MGGERGGEGREQREHRVGEQKGTHRGSGKRKGGMVVVGESCRIEAVECWNLASSNTAIMQADWRRSPSTSPPWP